MKDQASSNLNNKRKFHPYENQRGMDLKKAQHTASGPLKKPNSQTLTKNNVPKRTKGLKPSHDQPQQTTISQPPQRQRGSGIRTNQRVMALSPDVVARYNELRSSLDKEKASTFRKSTNSTTPVHNMVLSPSSPVFEIDTQNVACFSDISIMIMDEGFALSESDFSEFKEHVMECDEVFWKQPTMEPMIQWDEEDYEVEWFDPIAPSLNDTVASKSTLEILLEQPLQDFMEHDISEEAGLDQVFQTESESPTHGQFSLV